MESVPSVSLMSLLKSTIENWFLRGEKKKKGEKKAVVLAGEGQWRWACLHCCALNWQGTNMHWNSPRAVNNNEIFIHGISWSGDSYCTCHLSGGRFLIIFSIMCAFVCQCISLLCFSALMYKIRYNCLYQQGKWRSLFWTGRGVIKLLKKRLKREALNPESNENLSYLFVLPRQKKKKKKVDLCILFLCLCSYCMSVCVCVHVFACCYECMYVFMSVCV